MRVSVCVGVSVRVYYVHIYIHTYIHIHIGGFTPTPASRLGSAQFYPPTILADVDETMLIWREEIFGPIVCITKGMYL